MRNVITVEPYFAGNKEACIKILYKRDEQPYLFFLHAHCYWSDNVLNVTAAKKKKNSHDQAKTSIK